MHTPVRPQWTCHSCREPWPCAERRAALAVEYLHAPASLGQYLSLCLVEALGDLPGQDAGEVYRRFLGWARPSPLP